MPKRKRPLPEIDSDEDSSSDDGELFMKMFPKHTDNIVNSKDKEEPKQTINKTNLYDISDSDSDSLPPEFDAVKPKLHKLSSKLDQFSKKSEDRSKSPKCICKSLLLKWRLFLFLVFI